MRRARIVLPLAMLFLLLSGALSLAAAAGKETKFEKMLAPRTITCWVEGLAMDELVIGARARLVFVCMDRKLGNEIVRLRPDGNQAAEYESVPEWLRRSLNFYARQKGKTFFAVQITTAKSWDFDLAKIRIGDDPIPKEDVLLGDALRLLLPPGESAVSLPSDFSDRLGLYVPSGLLKPGTEIQIGYDESLVTWVVPKN